MKRSCVMLAAIIALAIVAAGCRLVECRSDEPAERGVVLLSFDDRNFGDWERAIPLFAKYNAHATFFVCGEIDDPTVRSLKHLAERGHTIGLHGLTHADADAAVAERGAERYWREELWPQVDRARKGFVRAWQFAYPNCRWSEASDALLKAKGMNHARGGVKGATPYDPQGVKQANRKPLVTNEAVFFPSAELAKRFRIDTILMGEAYHTDIAEILACLRRAAERREVISITSHGISPDAKGIDMKTAWLEAILAEAQRLGLAVLGFDELPPSQE